MFVFANILDPLIDINDAILKFFHNDVGLGWGFSIIMLTVVVRLAILPLTFKQVRSMQALQQLQPEMKALQERYKDDKDRRNQEMMKFYADNKVNPLGSCLPLLLQFPFFLSLYYLQQRDEFKEEVGGEGFFFIPNLTENVTGEPVVLVTLMVIYVVTQLISSMVTAVNASDPTQKRIMYALPFFFVFLIINFPAGLILYWITTNVWTIGQQLAVRKFLPMPKPDEAAVGAGGGTKGKPAAAAAATDEKPKGLLARAREMSGAATEQPSNGGKASANGGKKGGATAKAPASGGGNGARKAPPPSPRKKKKRSGRRR